VRRTGFVFAALVIAACGFATLASARDPRRETERLRPADMSAARNAVIRLRDLNTGWKRDKKPDDDDSTTCPGFNPDFSRFVITGKATVAFAHPAGAWLISGTEIYASRQHAVGDFRLGARPELARCLRYMLEHETAKEIDPSVRVRVLSSRMLPSPRIGERSARYQVAARFAGPARTLTMYVDVFAFQQGRTIGFLMAMSVSQPIRDGGTLSRVMLSRFR
jgi:hypothetical protein